MIYWDKLKDHYVTVGTSKKLVACGQTVLMKDAPDSICTVSTFYWAKTHKIIKQHTLSVRLCKCS